MKSFALFTFFALTFVVFRSTTDGQMLRSETSQPPALTAKGQILGQLPIKPFSVAGTTLPLKMSYQGVLTIGGNPVTDGSYDLTVTLYDSLTNGTSQWTETHSGVPVQHGTFSLTLGVTTPLNLQFNKPLFIQLTATNGPAGPSYPSTFSPRSELLSSPYSLAPWVTKGNDLYYNNGKVGIGSSAPESSGIANLKLDIADEDGGNGNVAVRVAGQNIDGGGYPQVDFAKSRGSLALP